MATTFCKIVNTILESIFDAYEGGKVKSSTFRSFQMTFSMSRLIHKKWWPCEVLEARDLKFCMGPYFTYTHAVQKSRLDLRTF